MKFNKYKVLHLAKHNPGMQKGWDIYLAGEKLCEKGPGASGEHKFHMKEQGGATAKKANKILGCIKVCFSSREKEIITPLCSVLSRAHLEIYFFFPSIQKIKLWTPWKGSREEPKWLSKNRKSALWGKAEKSALFSLEETRLRGDLVTVIQYLKAGYKKKISYYKDCHGKDECYKLLLWRFWFTLEEHFSKWEKSAIGIICPDKRCIPKCWTLWRFGWTKCWASLSRLVVLLLPRKAGPDILHVPFQPGILWFYDVFYLD